MADLLATYHCNYCQDDISGCRIKCSECEDFDLCLEDPLGFSVFDDAWTSREDLLLLDAMEQYGYGNWEDVSRYIGTKSPEEARIHFTKKYVDGDLGQSLWGGSSQTMSRSVAKDHTTLDTGPLSAQAMSKLAPLDISLQEAILLGYMPQRDDFEREHDNDAETLVSQLAVSSIDDDELDAAFKLCHVDMYMQRLRERARRKRYSRDYQLAKKFFSDKPTSSRKMSKGEQKFAEKMKVFQQFHTAKEHDAFLETMQKERELRFRIRELMRYRRNGLRTHEECCEYEHARFKRDCRKKRKSATCGSSLEKAVTPKGENESDNHSALKKATPESLFSSQEDDEVSPKGSTLPGEALLSSAEKQICNSTNLKPSQYLSLKSMLLKDHLHKLNGELRWSVDSPSLQQVNAFLSRSGWLPVR